MLLLSYDISDDKLRTKFSKFISRFGVRLQYSVYKITNSERLLNNILSEIRFRFEPKFAETDSIMIFKMTNSCEIILMGCAKHESEDLIIV